MPRFVVVGLEGTFVPRYLHAASANKLMCTAFPRWWGAPACYSPSNHVETQVVLFNNQQQEVAQYDTFLEQYQLQMNRIERLGAQLNAGQAIILNCGIVAALAAAILRAPSGTGILPGDLVLIHGMLLQLWAPLQFLGWFWRCTARQSCGFSAACVMHALNFVSMCRCICLCVLRYRCHQRLHWAPLLSTHNMECHGSGS